MGNCIRRSSFWHVPRYIDCCLKKPHVCQNGDKMKSHRLEMCVGWYLNCFKMIHYPSVVLFGVSSCNWIYLTTASGGPLSGASSFSGGTLWDVMQWLPWLAMGNPPVLFMMVDCQKVFTTKNGMECNPLWLNKPGTNPYHHWIQDHRTALSESCKTKPSVVFIWMDSCKV